jgi:hypothetical protein
VTDKKVWRMRTKSWVGKRIRKLMEIKDNLLALLNYRGDQIIKDRIATGNNNKQRNQLGRQDRGYEETIEMNLTETGWKSRFWIHPPLDMSRRGLLQTKIKFGFHTVRNFSHCVSIRF